MKIVNKLLLDLTGAPIKAGDIDLSIATVLVNCALAPTANGQPRPASEVAGRYDLAVSLHRLKIDESIDISPEMLVKLKEDMLRVYATIVAGQMLPVLDGTVSH
jgi:hypothetical protein